MNIVTASSENIVRAAQMVQAGQVVAFPTETVYGLGADATQDDAVAAIFSLKNRPSFNPLIVHVDGVEMASRYVQWNAKADRLAAAFWPGPLTLVLPRYEQGNISLLVSAGGDTVGVRLPDHPVARALITATALPIAAPSANRSGRISPTLAAHVEEEFGAEVPLILDGGPCQVGVESTVLDISGEHPVLLRPGGVTREQIEKILQQKICLIAELSGDAMFKSPGMLQSHYAPSLPVRLNILEPRANEALLAFGPHAPQGAKFVYNLSVTGNIRQAASNLFAALRALDNPEFSAIAVMPIPEEGLGVAINDRLRRAAAAR